MRKYIHISIWEENDKKSFINIPVLPESLPTSVAGKAETIDIVGAGERVVFGGEKLDRFKMETFFPAHYDSSYVVESEGDYKTPSQNLQKLRAWIDLEAPLRLYSKEGGLNRSVVITNLDYDVERAGSLGDIFYTLDIMNYKPPHYRRVALKKTSGSGGIKTTAKKPTAPKASKLPATYTVKKGDYLGKVALAFYGKANYIKVYNANKKAIDAANKKAKARDKYTIHPGQKLTIPK
ncbi:LysM peptidoglycan-binding domain-containing protein [Sporosarcina sp. A2]|uniref:LysM peptidoglycan-binding domain-containing protein n=1 Tax=Sporosarcina sp. A2 TaxID=3393449 RepID=UPI003D7B8D5F